MKFKNIRIPESAFAMMAQAAQMLGALLVMLMLVRMFPKDIFGQWVLYQSLVALAEMARMGFVQNGMVRYAQSEPGQYRQILSGGLTLHFLVGLGLWGLLVSCSPYLAGIWKSEMLPQLCMAYGFTLFSLGSLRFLEYVQMANKDFRGVFGGNMIAGLSYALMVAYFFFSKNEMSLVWVIFMQGIAALFGCFFVLFFRKRFFTFGSLKFDWLKKLFHYGKFSLGTNLSSMLLQRVDIAMIAYFINPAAVAAYNIAGKAPNYMEVPLKGGAQYFFPKIAEVYKKEGKKATGDMYAQAMGMMLAINIPIFLGALLFAEPILWILGGADYTAWEVKVILYVLLSNTLIKPFARMFGTVLDAIGKPEVNFRMVAGSIFLNVGMNLLFVPAMGALGAAIGTILAMILMNIISIQILKKHIHINLQLIFHWIRNYYSRALSIIRLRTIGAPKV
ncbi:MAG: oligosaccharide flippase family protein [Bacteroidia bacterium]|nr:oligosaccharide flippase family protein [Bacteroidia bacterium]